MSAQNIVLLGAPGAGKGTQGQRLSSERSAAYLSTGDLLRGAVRNGTELGVRVREYLGSGGLVPDTVVVALIAERIEQMSHDTGFILDGFPRTVPQAEALGEILAAGDRAVTHAVLLDVDDETIVSRLAGRRVSAAGRIYHLENKPPLAAGYCDIDGSPLVVRDDDRPETVRARLAVYHEQTEPLIDLYDQLGVLHRIDGTAPSRDVQRALAAALSPAAHPIS